MSAPPNRARPPDRMVSSPKSTAKPAAIERESGLAVMDVLQGSRADKAAVAQVDQAIETVEDLLVMGNGDDAGLLLDGELAHQVHDQAGPRAVQRGGGFVG